MAFDVSNRLAVGSFTGVYLNYDSTTGASLGVGPSINALPNPKPPSQNIAPLPGAVRLSWTTNAGYLLETNDTLLTF